MARWLDPQMDKLEVEGQAEAAALVTAVLEAHKAVGAGLVAQVGAVEKVAVVADARFMRRQAKAAVSHPVAPSLRQDQELHLEAEACPDLPDRAQALEWATGNKGAANPLVCPDSALALCEARLGILGRAASSNS